MISMYPSVRALQWIDGTGSWRGTNPGWYRIDPVLVLRPNAWPWAAPIGWLFCACEREEFELL